MRQFLKLARDQRGQSMVEYALLTGAVVVALVAAMEYVVVGEGAEGTRVVQGALSHVYRFASTVVALPFP
ncbi:MAG: hypothetical protein HYZ53_06080 [Planctomycetes bacterium]|nr:hypothetical protein [Planctomycetota bacterium]